MNVSLNMLGYYSLGIRNHLQTYKQCPMSFCTYKAGSKEEYKVENLSFSEFNSIIEFVEYYF